MLPLRRAGGLWARRRQCPVLMVPQRQMNLMPALREVVKLDQLAKEPTETVREIWDLRHSEDPERVGAIISAAAFQEMRSRVARHPTFIFKVPRGDAAFTVLVSNFPVLTVDKPTTCLFTLADEYRASPHTCTPVLAVNFWNEFAKNKDLVLIRATILPGVALSRTDARRLLGLLLRYYVGDTAAGRAGFEVGTGVNYDTVRIFNEQPHQFDMEGYLKLHNSPTSSE